MISHCARRRPHRDPSRGKRDPQHRAAPPAAAAAPAAARRHRGLLHPPAGRANHFKPGYLRAYLCEPPAYHGRPCLAVISARTTAALWQALTDWAARTTGSCYTSRRQRSPRPLVLASLPASSPPQTRARSPSGSPGQAAHQVPMPAVRDGNRQGPSRPLVLQDMPGRRL